MLQKINTQLQKGGSGVTKGSRSGNQHRAYRRKGRAQGIDGIFQQQAKLITQLPFGAPLRPSHRAHEDLDHLFEDLSGSKCCTLMKRK